MPEENGTDSHLWIHMLEIITLPEFNSTVNQGAYEHVIIILLKWTFHTVSSKSKSVNCILPNLSRASAMAWFFTISISPRPRQKWGKIRKTFFKISLMPPISCIRTHRRTLSYTLDFNTTHWYKSRKCKSRVYNDYYKTESFGSNIWFEAVAKIYTPLYITVTEFCINVLGLKRIKTS